MLSLALYSDKNYRYFMKLLKNTEILFNCLRQHPGFVLLGHMARKLWYTAQHTVGGVADICRRYTKQQSKCRSCAALS